MNVAFLLIFSQDNASPVREQYKLIRVKSVMHARPWSSLYIPYIPCFSYYILLDYVCNVRSAWYIHMYLYTFTIVVHALFY